MTTYKLINNDTDEAVIVTKNLDDIVNKIVGDEKLMLQVMFSNFFDDMGFTDAFIVGRNGDIAFDLVKANIRHRFGEDGVLDDDEIETRIEISDSFRGGHIYYTDENDYESIGFTVTREEDKIDVELKGKYTKEELLDEIKKLTEKLEAM